MADLFDSKDMFDHPNPSNEHNSDINPNHLMLVHKGRVGNLLKKGWEIEN